MLHSPLRLLRAVTTRLHPPLLLRADEGRAVAPLPGSSSAFADSARSTALSSRASPGLARPFLPPIFSSSPTGSMTDVQPPLPRLPSPSRTSSPAHAAPQSIL